MFLRLFSVALFTLMVWVNTSAVAQTYADPQPTMDNPRRVVVSISTKDEARINSILYNIINIQKHYGQDNVRIAVIGYGPGVRMLMKDSPVAARVRSQMLYDIEFVACGNTMDIIGKKKSDMIEGVEWVKAGLPEIIERRLKGWVDIKP